MPCLKRDPDFALWLESPDAWPVAGARINDDERPLSLIDNGTDFPSTYGYYRIDSRAEADPISAGMSPNDDSALAPRCPKCSGHGLARGLELRLDRYTLRYECNTCHHEWHVTDFVPVQTWNGIPIEPA